MSAPEIPDELTVSWQWREEGVLRANRRNHTQTVRPFETIDRKFRGEIIFEVHDDNIITLKTKTFPHFEGQKR